MKKIIECCVWSLAFLPLTSLAQQFEDTAGKDNERYLAVLFPKPEPAEGPASSRADVSYLTAARETLVTFSSQYVGLGYRYGGTSGAGFDCSGFTRHIFEQVGIALPHSSAAQANTGELVPEGEVQVGDLVFFKGGNRNSPRVGHVGMVCEVLPEGRFKIIHSTNHGGVMIEDPMQSAYFRPRFLFIRRVLK
ncbi:MAG TPA: C40 family peptidase [Luteibaculaceae bacterium]|nr:C40 family peptidase [Luteibaculaceae bacterium]